MISPYTFTLKAALIAIGIALLVILLIAGPSQCAKRKTAEKQAEVSAGQGSANINAAQEAGNTTSAVIADDARADAIVAQGQAEVRAAAKGQKGPAARRAICRSETYRDTPMCKGAK